MDLLAFGLRDLVANARCNLIGHGRSSARSVLCHMGQHLHRLQGLNELIDVVAFVGAQRNAGVVVFVRLPGVIDHRFSRLSFGVPIGLRHADVDDSSRAGCPSTCDP